MGSVAEVRVQSAVVPEWAGPGCSPESCQLAVTQAAERSAVETNTHHGEKRITFASSPALMSMTTPAATVLLRCAASVPYLRLPPRASSPLSAAPLPRRWRWCSPVRSLPPEGVPAGLTEEDSKFVPLNEDDPMYGPPALLLIGFEKGETHQILMFLKELEGDFLKVIHCTEEMTKKTLWDAMHADQPNLEAVEIAESMPRICIFSGLTGEEMMMFINVFPEAGLEPAAFAALVPNSADKVLDEVIEEIMGDHEMLTGKKSD